MKLRGVEPKGQEKNMENENKNVNTGANTEPAGTENKTKTFDDFLAENKDFQAEFDRRMTKGNQTAIEKAKEQWKLEQDEQKSEAEKLASMNEKQKSEYELKKANKERDNALAELNAYQLKEQALTIASEKGLDVNLLNLIDFKTVTAEKLSENIDNLSAVFNKAVEKAVNEKLKEDTPITKTSGMAGGQPKPIPTIF